MASNNVPEKDNLFTNFLDLEGIFNTIQKVLEDVYSVFPGLSAEALPDFEKFLHLVFIKKGAMLQGIIKGITQESVETPLARLLQEPIHGYQRPKERSTYTLGC